MSLCHGNLVTQYSAFNIPSRGLALSLVFTYNSLTNAWTHTYATALTEQANGDVIYTDGDGASHLFTLNGDGTYAAPAGNYDTRVKHGNGTFMLTHTDQPTHEFDINGRLTALHDRYNNTIALAYNGSNLTQAQAAGGQSLTFGYTNGNLSTVTDNANHVLQLTWNNGGRITHLTDPLNFDTQFSYSGRHLATLADPRNNVTTNGNFEDFQIKFETAQPM